MENIATVFNQGLFALKSGDFVSAEKIFRSVVQKDKSNVAALNLLAVILMNRKEFGEAENFISRAISIDRSSDVSFYNYGIISKQLNKLQQALEQFDNALKLNPNVPETWNNRGIISNDLERPELAIADFDKAISLNHRYSDAYCNKGKSLALLQRYDEAIAAYNEALAITPNLEAAWLGLGRAFSVLKRHGEAIAAYNKALSIRSDQEIAWLGLGNVLFALKRYDEAVAAYDRALTIKPGLGDAWFRKGNALVNLERYDEAILAYDKVLSFQPDLPSAEGERLRIKMHLCDWRNLDEEIAHLAHSIHCGKANSFPLDMLTLADSPDIHIRCAEAWVAAKLPAAAAPLWQGAIYAHDKIHIGYVSADFRNHAVAVLMAEVFELHDRKKFSDTAFSLRADDGSEMRKRLIGSFDRFVDCENRPDAEIARLIADSEIDILVDLNGFTNEARTAVFAHRPAPIQVNYLGYPGTMGAPFIDYIIGDKTIFTLADSKAYSEKLVRLPHTYQPNDRKRKISEKPFRREDFGLPDGAFVFCCFNMSHKIFPSVFDGWMRILQRVEGSVLWLLSESRTTIENLRKEAAHRGVDPARLVFAKIVHVSEHLARHALADLFLDTLPYNAHTTTSDALWTGLPVLTRKGNAFAGRVSASLLNAVGLPELITHSQEEYEALAIQLALDPERLREIKEKLRVNCPSAPLFDTPLFTGNLERAYEAMYRRYRLGLAPDHIDIS